MLTICGESLHRAGGAKGARVGDTHDGDENNGIEDTWEHFDASKLNSNDKGRAKRLGTSISSQRRGVGGHNEADQGKVDDVKQHDTVDDLLGGFGDFLSRVGGFSSG